MLQCSCLLCFFLATILLFVLVLFYLITDHRTWIVGDSFVRRAGLGNPQLQGCGRISWLGLGGDRVVTILDRLRGLLRGRPSPHTIVLHVGSNDIFALSKKDLCEAVELLLRSLRQVLPGCRLVWSHILPRLFWYGERNLGAGEKVRKEVNRCAYNTCKALSGDNRVIFHHGITGRDHSLYERRDGIHLSPKGFSVFRNQIQGAIRYFNAAPETLIGYPPLDR